MESVEKEKLISNIKRLFDDGIKLNATSVKKEYPSLFHFASKNFGSWSAALKASGLEFKKVPKKSAARWSKEKIIEQLLKIPPEELVDKTLRKKHSKLYTACLRLFGSRKNALEAAGIDYESTLANIPWSKTRVLSTIQNYHLNDIPLNFKFISNTNTKLKKNKSPSGKKNFMRNIIPQKGFVFINVKGPFTVISFIYKRLQLVLPDKISPSKYKR